MVRSDWLGGNGDSEATVVPGYSNYLRESLPPSHEFLPSNISSLGLWEGGRERLQIASNFATSATLSPFTQPIPNPTPPCTYRPSNHFFHGSVWYSIRDCKSWIPFQTQFINILPRTSSRVLLEIPLHRSFEGAVLVLLHNLAHHWLYPIHWQMYQLESCDRNTLHVSPQ